MRTKLYIFIISSVLVWSNLSAEEKKTSVKDLSNTDLKFYTGTFDWLDVEGDERTSLFGIEHKDSRLYRNTFLGKFAPITGGFITAKNSIYMYTGIEAQYKLGPINITPSFAPGFYEKGNGKDLGLPLEFKSEISLGFGLFEDAKVGYSYSHISNNTWGETNPGTDNQTISFSTKF